MTVKRILVNREAVLENARSGSPRLPVYTIIEGDRTQYANSVAILGPSVLCYNHRGDPEAGRRVWIETSSRVITRGAPNFLDESDKNMLETPCDGCDNPRPTHGDSNDRDHAAARDPSAPVD